MRGRDGDLVRVRFESAAALEAIGSAALDGWEPGEPEKHYFRDAGGKVRSFEIQPMRRIWPDDEPGKATAVNWEFDNAKRALAGAVESLHKTGTLLLRAKADLPHGRWLPWLAEHRDALGFNERTAQRLMALANTTLAADLSEAEASRVLRKVWSRAPLA